MTLQHSPGPWVFDEWDFAIYSKHATVAWDCSIVGEHATIATFASDDLPTEADGRLMAAAPDMLRLLRVLVKTCDSDMDGRQAWLVLNAALNEASELIARLDGDT